MIAWSDFLLVIAVAIGTVGVIYSIHSVILRNRAEQELQRRLDDSEEREQLAETILDKPNQTNIQNGRKLVVKAVSSMNPRYQKQIALGLNQSQTKGRNAYIVKVVAGSPKLRNHGLSVTISRKKPRPIGKVRGKVAIKKMADSNAE